MKVAEFLAAHPLFTKEEFVRALGVSRTRDVQLDYYRKRGRLLRVRRGLYATVPPGVEASSLSLDPFLLAAKLAPDAVIAYHSALALHGRAESHRTTLTTLSSRAVRPFSFQGMRYVGVRHPRALRTPAARGVGVETADRQGIPIRVTGLERTMVDVLDRPDLSGGWEEIWTSLEAVEYFDLDALIRYALLLGNATTIAKVGFYLESHRQALMVEDAHLERLRKRRPQGRSTLSRGGREKGRLVSGWNLVVPAGLFEQAWKEPS